MSRGLHGVDTQRRSQRERSMVRNVIWANPQNKLSKQRNGVKNLLQNHLLMAKSFSFLRR